ncbi:18924_t:CDS:1, partial [Racocetra fulgida]
NNDEFENVKTKDLSKSKNKLENVKTENLSKSNDEFKNIKLKIYQKVIMNLKIINTSTKETFKIDKVEN